MKIASNLVIINYLLIEAETPKIKRFAYCGFWKKTKGHMIFR